MHFKQDTVIKLLLWSKLILWSYFEYQEISTKIDDFYFLSYEQGWQDTIRFKEEGQRCSILKRWVLSRTYFLRNILRDFRELHQRGRHIQLMELPIRSICWGINFIALYKPTYQILASYWALTLQKVCGGGRWWCWVVLWWCRVMWWWWWVVCWLRVTLAFSFGLGQAEQ